jgi:MATE family, multidrug efflux pump
MIAKEKTYKEGGVRELLSVAYPLIISMSSVTVMQFLNRMFISWYSTDGIAAIIPAGGLHFSFVCFFMGVAYYTNVFIAQYYGKKQYAKVSVSLWQGVFLAFFAWVILIALVPLGRFVIDSTSHPQALKVLEKPYFTLTTLFGGFVIINAALSTFFTGRGKTKVTMTVNIIGNLINIVFAWALVFGKGPFPEMGMQGAAVSYVIGNFSIGCMFLFLILRKQNQKRYRVARLFTFYKPIFKNLIKYGAPGGVTFFVDIFSFTVFIFLIGNVNKYILAATNITIAIDMIAFLPVLGMGVAVQTLIGQYIGKGRKDMVNKIVKSAMKIGFTYSVVISFLFFTFPEIFINLFGSGSVSDFVKVHNYTFPLLKILSVFIFFDTANLIFSDSLKGAGDTAFQMISAAMVGGILFIPGTYILIKYYQAPIELLWIWATVFIASLALVYFLRFRSGEWKKIDITKLEKII